MVSVNWQKCTDCLKAELPSQQFNTWIRPLQAEIDSGVLRLRAPNRFILDWVKGKFLTRIQEIFEEMGEGSTQISLEVSDLMTPPPAVDGRSTQPQIVTQAASSNRATNSQQHIQTANLGSKTIMNLKRGVFSDPLSSISGIQRGHPERRNVDTIIEGKLRHRGALNRENTFENFIEGKSNQLARAAAIQVATNTAP